MDSQSRLNFVLLSYFHAASLTLATLLRDDIDAYLNLPHHNLDPAELVRALQRMV